MLEFLQVSKSYNHHQVLKEITLSIQTGQTIGLIGANGEGKTTLFKCLLDVCEIDQGDIRVFDLPHTDPLARAQLAFLPEHFQAPFYLNGQQYLQMMLGFQQSNCSQGEIDSVLSALLFDFNSLKNPVTTFSKGMMQKIGLTACLCSNKQLLILDEPMSGLDPAARYGLKQLLIEQKNRGKTLIFSTHLLHDIEQLCDQIAILGKGEIRFHGKVEEALKTYQTTSLEQAYLRCLDISMA